jgi:hypothetical protein
LSFLRPILDSNREHAGPDESFPARLFPRKCSDLMPTEDTDRDTPLRKVQRGKSRDLRNTKQEPAAAVKYHAIQLISTLIFDS